MKVALGAWGISVELFGLVAHLYLGDMYLRAPRLGEIAWNSTGLYTNRLSRQ